MQFYCRLTSLTQFPVPNRTHPPLDKQRNMVGSLKIVCEINEQKTKMPRKYLGKYGRHKNWLDRVA